MMVGGNVSPLCVFTYTRKKMLSSRGIRQRSIIKSLAIRKQNVTRSALSKLLAEEFGIPESHAYHYVLKELQECLIPNGIVEEAGNVKPLRGSRILLSNGIPCYRLTRNGILIALSLDDLNIEKRKELLERYLVTTKILSASEIAFCEQLLSHLHNYPEATIEKVRNGVFEFIDGRLKNPLDMIKNDEKVVSKDYSHLFSYIFESCGN